MSVAGPYVARHPSPLRRTASKARQSSYQGPVPAPAQDLYYGHADTAHLAQRFIQALFACPNRPPPSSASPATPTPTLALFVAYALHRTRLHPSVTFTALFLLSRLKSRFPAARGSSGHRLFISAFMIASKVVCDDTYSNKSWTVVGQGMFSLREINQMEREMCGYLEWGLNVDPKELAAFEARVRKEYALNGPCPPFVHPPQPAAATPAPGPSSTPADPAADAAAAAASHMHLSTSAAAAAATFSTTPPTPPDSPHRRQGAPRVPVPPPIPAPAASQPRPSPQNNQPPPQNPAPGPPSHPRRTHPQTPPLHPPPPPPRSRAPSTSFAPVLPTHPIVISPSAHDPRDVLPDPDSASPSPASSTTCLTPQSDEEDDATIVSVGYDGAGAAAGVFGRLDTAMGDKFGGAFAVGAPPAFVARMEGAGFADKMHFEEHPHAHAMDMTNASAPVSLSGSRGSHPPTISASSSVAPTRTDSALSSVSNVSALSAVSAVSMPKSKMGRDPSFAYSSRTVW